MDWPSMVRLWLDGLAELNREGVLRVNVPT